MALIYYWRPDDCLRDLDFGVLWEASREPDALAKLLEQVSERERLRIGPGHQGPDPRVRKAAHPKDGV